MAVKEKKIARAAAPAILSEGWRRVKFGDVVRNVDVTERNPLENGLERYVGLEHLDPESLHIKRWGLIEEGTSFTRKFVKGQVLFGKRRAYQRKAAVADFDGICSGDILVFEAKSDDLIPELLPLIVQSEGFYEKALGTSAGSLSPRTKWKDLAEYEFALPPKDEQHRIADILYSCDESIRAFQEAEFQVRNCKQLIFDELLFGESLIADDEKTGAEWLDEIRAERRSLMDEASDPQPLNESTSRPLPTGWCWARAEQICGFITKGTTPAKDKLYAGAGEVPYVKVYNLTNTGVLDFSVDPTFIDATTHLNELSRSRVFPNDVLMNIVGPPLGKVSKVPDSYAEWNINQAIAVFRPLGGYKSDFLSQYLLRAETQGWLYQRSKKTSGQRNLTLELCRDLPIPVPPPSIQRKIDLILRRVDNSIGAIRFNVENLISLKKSLMRRLLQQH